MTHEFTHSAGIRTLALLTVLAIVVASYATTATAFAAAQVPTLTNDVGQPSGGAEPQLALGVGLLAIGLLGIVIGLAAYRTPHRAASAGVPRRESGELMQRIR